VCSENPSGAGNQQERPGCSAWLDRIPSDLGHYIAGFVDGEGSFNVPIRREQDRRLAFRVGLSFNVSQVGEELPELLKLTFGVGTTRSRPDGVWYFEVTKLVDLEERVFPFFDRFRLRGPKASDLVTFRRIAALVRSREHLCPCGYCSDPGIEVRHEPRRKETSNGRRDPIGVGHRESSEAIRRAPCRSAGMKIWSTPHGDMGSDVNYNGPKVGSPKQARGAAPRTGDGVVRSRLFAGSADGSSTTRSLLRAVTM